MKKRKLVRATKDKIIGCRFDFDESQKLNRIADAHGVPVTTVLRWAVKYFRDETTERAK